LTAGYTSDIKAKIRKEIEEYFAFVGQSKEKAYEMFQRQKGKRKGFNKEYNNHLGRGCVYLFTLQPSEDEYERMNPGDYLECKKGVLIKIGYSANLDQRLGYYENDCKKKVRSKPIETFPETPIDAGKDFGALGFAHLLEKILHQIWTLEQYDIHCICSDEKDRREGKKVSDVVNMTCHMEVFLFERKETETRKEAFNENIRFMKPHILKWMDAIKSLDDLYRKSEVFHNRESGDSITRPDGPDGGFGESDDGSEESDTDSSTTPRKKEKEER
ncbi:hypothetical protein BGX21_004777, partial [Mortierella sp. AD011]